MMLMLIVRCTCTYPGIKALMKDGGAYKEFMMMILMLILVPSCEPPRRHNIDYDVIAVAL